MKNKKIITRVLTLLASVLLVFALTIPCFADASSDGNDYVINTITFSDGDTAYQWIVDNGASILRVTGNIGVTGIGASFDTIFPILVDGSISGLRGSSFVVTNMIGDDGTPSVVADSVFFELDADYLRLSPFIMTTNLSDSELPDVFVKAFMENAVTVISIPNNAWDDIDLSMTVEYMAEYVQKDISRSGMFGQVYDIIRDAIFGSDVILDNSQDFVLTQISTWLTYIVLLLPILVIGIILWKVFIR